MKTILQYRDESIPSQSVIRSLCLQVSIAKLALKHVMQDQTGNSSVVLASVSISWSLATLPPIGPLLACTVAV